jgi:hypothetical protein
LHVQRVHAHRAVHVVIFLGQGFDVGSVVDADADTQKVPYPALSGGIKGGIEGAVVGSEIKAIKVTMGIYEHKKDCNLHRMSRTVGLQCSGQMGFDATARGVVAVVELHADTGGSVALGTFGRDPSATLPATGIFSGSSIRFSSMNTSSPNL